MKLIEEKLEGFQEETQIDDQEKKHGVLRIGRLALEVLRILENAIQRGDGFVVLVE